MPDSFSESDLKQAVDDLATMPFFPQESRGAVMFLLAKMCPHREALRWLVAEAVDHVTKWPSLAELRGLLCTRFEPADGVDQQCTLPGYTREENEARYIAQHEARKTQERVGGYISAPESQAMVKQLAGEVSPVSESLATPELIAAIERNAQKRSSRRMTQKREGGYDKRAWDALVNRQSMGAI